MAMLGLSEMLIMLLFTGGAAIPVSVPPLEEDPVLANVAPQTCLFYSQWAGMGPANPQSDNDAEKFLADPEIRSLMSEVERRVLTSFARIADEAPGPPQRMLVEKGPNLAKLLLTRPLAVFATELDFSGDAPKIKAGLVINAGDQAAELKESLVEVQSAMLGDRVKTVKFGDDAFHQFQPAPKAPIITWGMKKKYLIVGIGEEVVEGILERARTKPPKWLEDAKKRFPIKRRSTLTYGNLASLLKKTTDSIPDRDGAAALQEVLKSTGASGLKSYVNVAGLNEGRFVSETAFDLDGPPKGVFKAIGGKPLAAADLNSIPRDATVALAQRIDAAALLDTVLAAFDKVTPEFREGLERAETELGVELRADVLASLGDVWRLYSNPKAGGLMTGWTLSVAVRNQKKLNEILQRFLDLVRAEGPPDAGEAIKSIKFGGAEIYYVAAAGPGMPIAPSWCLTEKEFIVGLFPQTIKAHLASLDTMTPSLATVPDVASMLDSGASQSDKGVVSLMYYDPKPLVHLAYPFLQVGLQAMYHDLGRAMRRGEPVPDLDISLLPTAGALTRHLRPTTFAWRTTEQGFESTLRQSLPGGSAGAVAPVGIALMLPAVSSAREAARRTQGINNLKQFALAVHNYHDVHRGLPARYSVDKDGKPLLSWRVHILPYIEQAALYERFHFDEPWDSEHNKALIPLMPPIYKAPGSKAAPGKTNYLAIAGESAMFPPPNKDQRGVKTPLGVGFRDVTDGTSNTAMFVEAGDKSAVVWTKPDDLDLDAAMMMDVMKRLLGMRPGGFSMAFADGHVRFISQAVDREVLNAILTRNGGEAVRLP